MAQYRQPLSSERGQVLIVGLIILLLMLIAGVSMLNSSVEDEKATTNARAQSFAFMAAEAGMYAARDSGSLEGVNWYDFVDADTGDCADNFVLESNNAFANNSSYIVTVEPGGCGSGTIHLLSVGSVNTINAERQVAFSLAYTGARPAPINFVGDIETYEGGNSNVFEVDGSGGIAVSTNDAANRDKVYQNVLEEDRLDNYKGGIDNITFDDPWDSPARIQELVEAITADPEGDGYPADVYVGETVPVDLGSAPDNYRTTVITGDADIDMKGNNSGAGLLIVTGDINFTGTPTWDGIIIALGGTVNINGAGTGYVNGTMFIMDMDIPETWDYTNPDNNTDDEAWGWGEGSVYIQKGGGTANYIYNCDNVKKAHALMPEGAQDIWSVASSDGSCGGAGNPLGVVYIDSWREIVNQ